MKSNRIMYILPLLLFFAACDNISVDEVESMPPVITSFEPQSAPVGAIVKVMGEHLNNVTEAYIGDVKVDIVEKVSDKRLSLRVVSGVISGSITLVNPIGVPVHPHRLTAHLRYRKSLKKSFSRRWRWVTKCSFPVHN